MTPPARKTRRARGRGDGARPLDWPQLIGELTIALVILLVPLVLNPRSKNSMDVKDVVLGITVAIGFRISRYFDFLTSSVARTFTIIHFQAHDMTPNRGFFPFPVFSICIIIHELPVQVPRVAETISIRVG